MADDGMFLNFAVGENLGVSVQRFKGGAWRDRIRAKRGAKFRAQKGTETDPSSQANTTELGDRVKSSQARVDDSSEPRPTKRRRENAWTSGTHTTNRSSEQRGQRQNDGRALTGSREVISSLFSYNPAASTTVPKPEEQPTDVTPTKPSNAPLVDGIDTFTSLGLSPTVAAHLLTKMNLKNPTAIQKAAVSQMLRDDGDAFIQSETGSGKTLAYLLPLVQRIMTISETQKDKADSLVDPALHRDSGLFAIILAPTRELCKQISVVLERLLGCAHYIVAGTVIGGEKKKSEKARLRKGVNILVATPGRLVDHLDNTKVLDVSTVRWLVLDEGDRLVDLGFEEDISKIVKTLDQKKRRSLRAGLPEKRTTVLCSATLKMNVQKLGEISLKDAVLIKGETEDADGEETTAGTDGPDSAFLAPAQLKQSYMVVAAKLRLVTLTALLKRTFARKGSVMKAIVFFSCADSVEFHYRAFSRALDSEAAEANDATSGPSASSDPAPSNQPTQSDHDSHTISPILSTPQVPNPLSLYKLHGSLPQPVRTSIVKSFASANTSTPSLLLATDVASRGLDLPNLDLVIEYDPAFSAEDHLHRIGRTARLGRDGRAVIFLLPGKEEGYVEVLHKSYKKADTGALSSTGSVTLTDANEILRRGFSASSGIASLQREWEGRATAYQLSMERWVLSSPALKELARKAFQSHVRAYATHTAAERKWFDIKELHLGHLAKSFGLRDAPGRMNLADAGRGGGRKRMITSSGEKKERERDGEKKHRVEPEKKDTADEEDAARKMREKVRNRKMMMGAGADEFNIA